MSGLTKTAPILLISLRFESLRKNEGFLDSEADIVQIESTFETRLKL